MILEASFSDPKHHRQYLDASEQNPSRLFTIEPEPFVLGDLNFTRDGNRKIKSFKATVYEGHFERGGTPLIKGAELTVEKIIHFRGFDFEETRPSRLIYLVFGGNGEYFIAHRITRPPDFDQIVSVTVDESLMSNGLSATATLVTAKDLGDDIRSRIKEKQAAIFSIPAPYGKGAQIMTKLTGVHEIYLETGDLAQ